MSYKDFFTGHLNEIAALQYVGYESINQLEARITKIISEIKASYLGDEDYRVVNGRNHVLSNLKTDLEILGQVTEKSSGANKERVYRECGTELEDDLTAAISTYENLSAIKLLRS